MKLPSKNFCPAPFVQGYINANNRAHKLCCMSDIVGRFDGTKPLQDTFQQFWNGDMTHKWVVMPLQMRAYGMSHL